jgi:signal peptidase I
MVDIATHDHARPKRLAVAPIEVEKESAAAWVLFCAALMSRSILVMTCSLLLWATLPALWGWTPTTVMSGSMGPHIRPGDVVVAMPIDAEDITIGQVLLVDDPDRTGELRLHRLVAKSPDGELRLQGDANPTPDQSTVSAGDVHGVGVLLIPLVGLPAVWLHQVDVGKLLTAALGLGGALLLSAKLQDPATATVLGDAGHGRRRRRASDRVDRFRRAGGLVTLFAIIAVVIIANSTAHANFTAATANPGIRLATGTFPCLQRAPFPSTYLTYRFNDAPGTTAADGSGNDHHGALTPGVSFAAGTCRPGDSPSLQLGGVRGQVTTDVAVDAPQVFAVESWFRTTSTTGGLMIGFGNLQAQQSTKYDRQMYLSNDGAVYFGAYNGTNVAINSAPGLNDGAWHLATATMGSAGMALYVDGRQVASNPNTKAEVSNGYWRIGFDSLNGWPGEHATFHFAGNLDNVTVYDDTLTASAVEEHFRAGR